MLKLSKTILRKVSFDKGLFRKELIKFSKLLNKQDLQRLYAWCMISFTGSHLDIVKDVLTSLIVQ